MPIVDDENQLHDVDLTSRFQQHFSSGGNGRIIDAEGNYWYICQENELLNFVSLLENNIGVPIGRILHNSAADSFELILSPLSKIKFGLFANRKRSKLLTNYWQIFGWGSFDSKNHSIITNVYPSIIAGFYLSLKEFEQGYRSRIQWKQVQEKLILCELEKLQKEISPPLKIECTPWNYMVNKQEVGVGNLIEIQDVGWTLNGRVSYVLPCDFINRLIFNLGGYTDKISSKLSGSWQLDGIDNRISGSFSNVLESFKELFLSGDVFVYLNDQNNWDSVISSHLNPFGLGSVLYLHTQDDVDHFEVSLEPNAPIVIGKLCGIWERANGKKSKCKIQISNNAISLQISSLLTYN